MENQYTFGGKFGETGLCDYIRNFSPDKNFSGAIHSRIGDYLRLYFFIGGMPEAIQTYIEQIRLTDIKNLCTDFEGALAEQFVGQEFIASSSFFKETKLYYWMREAKNSNAEIDYLIQIENEIYPVEVKAGKTGTLKSLQVFLGTADKQKGIRFNLDLPNYGNNLQAAIRVNNQNRSINYSLISLPLYFAGFIGDMKLM